MNSLSEVTLEQFQSALTDGVIRTFQIIQAALGLGVVLFIAVIMFIYLSQPPADPGFAQENVDLIKLLTLIHVVMAATIYYGSIFLYNLQFTEARLKSAVTQEFKNEKGIAITEPALKCLTIIRSAIIIRLALLEGSALFGLVVCFLAVTNGVMYHYPVYWSNLITTALFVGFIILLFPNRARIENIFTSKIAEP